MNPIEQTDVQLANLLRSAAGIGREAATGAATPRTHTAPQQAPQVAPRDALVNTLEIPTRPEEALLLLNRVVTGLAAKGRDAPPAGMPPSAFVRVENGQVSAEGLAKLLQDAGFARFQAEWPQALQEAVQVRISENALAGLNANPEMLRTCIRHALKLLESTSSQTKGNKASQAGTANARPTDAGGREQVARPAMSQGAEPSLADPLAAKLGKAATNHSPVSRPTQQPVNAAGQPSRGEGGVSHPAAANGRPLAGAQIGSAATEASMGHANEVRVLVSGKAVTEHEQQLARDIEPTTRNTKGDTTIRAPLRDPASSNRSASGGPPNAGIAAPSTGRRGSPNVANARASEGKASADQGAGAAVANKPYGAPAPIQLEGAADVGQPFVGGSTTTQAGQWRGLLPLVVAGRFMPAWLEMEWQPEDHRSPGREHGGDSGQGKNHPDRAVSLTVNIASETLGKVGFHFLWLRDEIVGSIVAQRPHVATEAREELPTLQEGLRASGLEAAQLRVVPADQWQRDGGGV